jgi:Protein of unknown function (DUF3810)
MQRRLAISPQLRAWILPLVLVLLIWLLQQFPGIIETYYAQGIYPYIGWMLRVLFGWLPFSVGDVLIAVLIIVAVTAVVKAMRKKKYYTGKLGWLKHLMERLLKWMLWSYILFECIWGLNYYRKGSAYLLQLQPDVYTTADVDTLLNTVNARLHSLSKDSVVIRQSLTQDRRHLNEMVTAAYTNASQQYGWLTLHHTSLKPNLLGPLQSYTGYGGYLFPFTGEAQVNFHAPAFTLPFTVSHEMAHQLGFGSESEANLIGYLAGRQSASALLQYSTYAEMHDYAVSDMWVRDSVLAKQRYKEVPYMLQQHRKEMRQWVQAHKHPAQQWLNWMYERYLWSNNQPQGLQSYNRVVAWLIAYGKKYGWHQL